MRAGGSCAHHESFSGLEPFKTEATASKVVAGTGSAHEHSKY